MKKILLSTLMFLALSFINVTKVNAIEGPYPVGTILVSGHMGFVPGVGLNVSGDYVLVDEWWEGHFTVGGYMGFNMYERNFHGVTNISVLPRATYGLNITNDFEVHGGVMMGLVTRVRSFDDFTDNEKEIVPDGGIFIGCKYFVTEDFGFSAEMNYTWSASYLNLGVAFRF